MSEAAPNLPSIDDIVSGIISNPKTGVSAADPVVETEAPAVPSMEEQAAAVEETIEEVLEVTADLEEAPVEVVEEAPVKREDPMSRRFAVLSRREREIQQRQREIETREAEIQRRLAEVQAPKAEVKPTSALQALKQLGFSYQDATLEVLGQKEEAPVDPMQQRLDELSERLKKVDELEKAQNAKWEKLEKDRAQTLEVQIRNSITATASSDEDKYELINTVGNEAFDLVYDVMERYYQEQQALLTYEEACDIVEQYYEDRAKSLSNTRKIGQRLATVSNTKPVVASKQASVPAKASGPKTLTQRHSTTAAVEPNPDSLNRDEFIKHFGKKIPIIED